MKKDKEIEGVILWHRDGFGTMKAFDVFVKKKFVKKYEKKFGWLYKVDCKVAEFWLKRNKGFVWLGSEDDLHIYPLNFVPPKKFKVIFFDDMFDKEFQEYIKKEVKGKK